MITDLFLSVFGISVATGGIAAVCMILLPVLNRRYAAKWSYYIWIFLALRLLLPVSGEAVLVSAQRAVKAFSQEKEVQRDTVPVALPRQRVVIEIPSGMTMPIAPQREERPAFTALDLAAYGWLLGCMASLLVPVCSYVCYRKRMLRETCALEDGAFFAPGNEDSDGGAFDGEIVRAQIREISEELHVRHLPSVRVYDGSISPMIMGVLRPVLVLPGQRYGEEELYFILKHELIHLKRHDVAVKLLLVAANAVHWFNPLIYLMKRRAAVDMELSCDERVIRGIAYADRKAYTETLFSTIQAACGKRTYLSTQFYGGKEIMKKRFQNIFTRVRKKNGVALFSCAVVLTITVGMLVSCGVKDAGAGGNFNTVAVKTGVGNAQAQRQEGMSDAELCERAKQYFAIRHGGMVPQKAEIDGVTDEGLVKIHLYDIAEDNSIAMTLDWYTVDRKTGIGEDVNFEPVNLMETSAQADEPAEEALLYEQMAGTWVIDFEQTENLWGSGISYGDEMAIARDGYGSFSYYIGIGVGGTGQCEVDGDALRVEVDPYEDNTEGTEVLTLRYVNKDGAERILMDWHGEDVYWMRSVKLPEETTLTFVKEGIEEQKQARLTYGDGFGLYLPIDEWQASAPDQWTLKANERVQLWAAHFDETSEDEVWQELEKNGYSFENGKMLQENGTMMLKIKLFKSSDGEDIWGVFYRYPAEAEEGWGMELSVIADTFVNAAETSDLLHSEPVQEEPLESEALNQAVEAFAGAYFGGDADGVRAYLADSFEGEAETYPGPGTAERLATRGLGTDKELPVGSTKEISLEFRAGTEDSFTYLTMMFVKQEDGWKVQWYGLEK